MSKKNYRGRKVTAGKKLAPVPRHALAAHEAAKAKDRKTPIYIEYLRNWCNEKPQEVLSPVRPIE